MIKTENFDKIEITSQQQLEEWLDSNHANEDSIWLVTYKKSLEDKYVSVSEVLDNLIAYGWIDGIRRKLDEDRTMQLIAPRKSQHWAKTYKDRASKLIADGKMTPAGHASIECSKKLGLWNFMDDVDALITPPDLQKALENHKGALTFFTALSPSKKRFVLRWIKLAKTEITRKKRINQTAELAAKGENIPGI